ncbi:MAG: hypothetical protein KAH32_06080 [Chlamydiia bacterium]|nr:hypothetical protein [Chlamydiia bacterium]
MADKRSKNNPVNGIITLVDMDKVKMKYTDVPKPKFFKADECVAKITFKLLELILADVLEKVDVVLDRKIGARIFVYMEKVHDVLIQGKNLKKNSAVVDLTKTNYTLPAFAYFSGNTESSLAKIHAPLYLWEALVAKVNSGVKYAKPAGVFFFWDAPESHRKSIKDRAIKKVNKWRRLKDIREGNT